MMIEEKDSLDNKFRDIISFLEDLMASTFSPEDEHDEILDFYQICKKLGKKKIMSDIRLRKLLFKYDDMLTESEEVG